MHLGGGSSINKLNAILKEVSEENKNQHQYFESIIAHINKVAGTTVRIINNYIDSFFLKKIKVLIYYEGKEYGNNWWEYHNTFSSF